jgi:G protein-coupled glucose receptor regulating Gpa2
VFSSLSIVTTSSLLIYLAQKTYRDRRAACKKSRVFGSVSIDGHENAYAQGYFWLVNLFSAGTASFGPTFLFIDFFQGIGLTLNTYSIAKNSAVPSPGCNAQGFFITAGDVASAWWAFVIAMHTFLLLAGGPKWRSWVAEKSVRGKFRWCLCAAIWLGVLFLSTVGIIVIQNINPEKGPFCIYLCSCR